MKSPRYSRGIWFFGAAIVSILSYFTARGILEHGPVETWLRVTVALMPVPPFIAFLLLFIANVRALDEMQRRIHLEALAVAFPLTMILLMTLGLLQRAIELPFEDWSYAHVWIYLPISYLLGLAIAKRRYE